MSLPARGGKGLSARSIEMDSPCFATDEKSPPRRLVSSSSQRCGSVQSATLCSTGLKVNQAVPEKPSGFGKANNVGSPTPGNSANCFSDQGSAASWMEAGNLG